MPDTYELLPGGDAEEHLWQHRLYVEDAYEVVDEGRYKVFPDGGHAGRLKIIGPDRGNRLLTIIVTKVDDLGRMFIVTGWPADTEESTLYSRPGGTQHA